MIHYFLRKGSKNREIGNENPVSNGGPSWARSSDPLIMSQVQYISNTLIIKVPRGTIF